MLPTIGSKELVALLAYLLEAKSVLIPEIAYPTYKVGALLARAEVLEVGIDANSWPKKADLAWINSPSNPTGRVHSREELEACLTWARKSGATLASDECYLPFTNGIKAQSILAIANGDNTSVLAVHSLSKRSNMAGYRGAFVAGDPKLIAQLLEIRKHMGMMLPLPIQKSMAIALSDQSHVDLNRLLFCLVMPEDRWKVFRRFYRVLSEDRIARFYGHRFNAVDATRIILGRPPTKLAPLRFARSFFPLSSPGFT